MALLEPPPAAEGETPPLPEAVPGADVCVPTPSTPPVALASNVAVAALREGLVEEEGEGAGLPLPLPLRDAEAVEQEEPVGVGGGVPEAATKVPLASPEPDAGAEGAALAVALAELQREPPPPREGVARALRAAVSVGSAPLGEACADADATALREAPRGVSEAVAVTVATAPDALTHPVALIVALSVGVSAALALPDTKLLTVELRERRAVPELKGEGVGEVLLPRTVAVAVPPPTPVPVGAPEVMALCESEGVAVEHSVAWAVGEAEGSAEAV